MSLSMTLDSGCDPSIDGAATIDCGEYPSMGVVGDIKLGM